MIAITKNRIRYIIRECKTEKDLVSALRSHKIRYTFSTDTGHLTIRIPCRKGSIHVYRSCSRSCPFMVHAVQSPLVFPVPVLHPDY